MYLLQGMSPVWDLKLPYSERGSLSWRSSRFSQSSVFHFLRKCQENSISKYHTTEDGSFSIMQKKKNLLFQKQRKGGGEMKLQIQHRYILGAKNQGEKATCPLISWSREERLPHHLWNFCHLKPSSWMEIELPFVIFRRFRLPFVSPFFAFILQFYPLYASQWQVISPPFMGFPSKSSKGGQSSVSLKEKSQGLHCA